MSVSLIFTLLLVGGIAAVGVALLVGLVLLMIRAARPTEG